MKVAELPADGREIQLSIIARLGANCPVILRVALDRTRSRNRAACRLLAHVGPEGTRFRDVREPKGKTIGMSSLSGSLRNFFAVG